MTMPASNSPEQEPFSPKSVELPPYVESVGEPGEDGGTEIQLKVKEDPRFTEDVIAAMQGSVDPNWAEKKDNGENQIELLHYVGSYAEGENAMNSLENYMDSHDQTHLWVFNNRDGGQSIVELDHIAFPADKREELEKLGVQLDPSGFFLGFDESAEVKEGPVATPSDEVLPEPDEHEESEAAEPRGEEEPVVPASVEELADKEVSSKGLPEGVSNNYNLYQRASGLLIAQSRASHSSKEHKSELEQEETYPEKQRPLFQRETTLAGKPFIIVERDGSNGTGENDTKQSSVAAKPEPKDGIYNWQAEGDFGEPPVEPPADDYEVDDVSDELQPQAETLTQMAPPEEPPNNNGEDHETEKLSVRVGRAESKRRGEDTILQREDLLLFGVFDGMGGVRNGALGSQTASKTIQEVYESRSRQPQTVEEALERMKYAMGVARQKVSEVEGFTTAIFGKIEKLQGKHYFIWGNAGDSRLFFEKDGEGGHESITSISTEHSLPDGTTVYNALTPRYYREKGKDKYAPYSEPTVTKDDEFGAIELSDGDRLMLCSDGITGDKGHQILTQKELQDAFDLVSPQDVADELLNISRKNDDKSVLVIDVSNEDE